MEYDSLVAVITRQQDVVKKLLVQDEVRFDIRDRNGDAPLQLDVKRGVAEPLEAKAKSQNNSRKTTSGFELHRFQSLLLPGLFRL